MEPQLATPVKFPQNARLEPQSLGAGAHLDAVDSRFWSKWPPGLWKMSSSRGTLTAPANKPADNNQAASGAPHASRRISERVVHRRQALVSLNFSRMKQRLAATRSNRHPVRIAALAVCIALSTGLANARAEGYSDEVVRLAGGAEIPIARYGRHRENDLVVWLPAGRGVQASQTVTALALTRLGYEVWVVDLHAAYFLPTGRNSLAAVPRKDLQTLIGRAVGGGGRRVFLLSSGRGAATALTAARDWQVANDGKTGINGLLLIHPNLYAEPPRVGELPDYLAVARTTNLPVYILQPEQSAKYYRLSELFSALGTGGAAVFSHSLAGVHDGFHLRPDDDIGPVDKAARSALPTRLSRAIELLGLQSPPATAASAVFARTSRAATPRRGLLRHTGAAAPVELELPTLSGPTAALHEYQGEVVLVSFWASWCPPCVEELPSMISLYSRYRGTGLQILAVNVGEAPATVRTFLRDFPVRFPILMDTSGKALKSWRVFAYPTNFLIGRNGTIQFSSYGAVDWMNQQNLSILEDLILAPFPTRQAGAASARPTQTNRQIQ